MKYEWKKEEKNIYAVKEIPLALTLPKQKFICINGIGNPNDENFKKSIEALYTIAYTIKMKFKDTSNYFDYTIYPLEGYWSLTDKGIKTQKETGKLDKNELKYILMIKQPDFVDASLFQKAIDLAIETKKLINLNFVYFDEIEEGEVVQILHIGPYDSEPESFVKINQFLKDNNYERTSFNHKEIYLSDARKTKPSKLKTILRVEVKKIK